MKVLVFPFSANPYQKLLYSQKTFLTSEITNCNYYAFKIDFLNRMYLPIQLIKYRFLGYRVFHLHWLYPFVHSSNIFWVAFNTVYIPFFLIIIKLLGYRLVWTAHNLLPHERTSLNDHMLMRILMMLSDKIIVHSDIQIESSKKVLIPHGNYVGFYPNVVTREEARKQLSLHNSDFVYLFFGHIKPYKGVETLIESFQKIENSNMRLLIVGECKDQLYLRSLKKMAKKTANITYVPSFISIEDVQYYFNAADVVVLPFKEVTTSGSFILASSFKKAVIAPCIGMFVNLSSNLGYFYSTSHDNVLSETMLKSFNQRKLLVKKGQLSYDYVSRFKWSEIANSTLNTYFKGTNNPEKKPRTQAVTK